MPASKQASRLSGAGFMAHEENIASVLKGDNRLVGKLGLTHPQLARPLFHVWNLILNHTTQEVHSNTVHLLYNGKCAALDWQGSRGWQESLFQDEILGMYQFEIRRYLDEEEQVLLRTKYPELTQDGLSELATRLSSINTGEMVPYYIMRYGFYEGHTAYRADPIAIAWIFGIRNLAEIEAAFPGNLRDVLTSRYGTPVRLPRRKRCSAIYRPETRCPATPPTTCPLPH